MGHDCPFCGAWVSGIPEDIEREDGQLISEEWFCPSCRQSFQTVYDFSEYLDLDGSPIPEKGDAE